MFRIVARLIIDTLFRLIHILWKIYQSLYIQYLRTFTTEYDIRCKNALVTGVTMLDSTGYEIAKELLNHDINIVISGKTQKGLDICCEALRKHNPNVSVYQKFADLSDLHQIKNLVDFTKSKFDKTHILINNAAYETSCSLLDTTIETIDHIVRSNQIGTMVLTRRMIEDMVNNREGFVVNFSSIFGITSISHQSVYGSTKAGVRFFSRSLRKEMAKHNVNVSLVSPAIIKGPTGQAARTEVAARARVSPYFGITTTEQVGKDVAMILKYNIREYDANEKISTNFFQLLDEFGLLYTVDWIVHWLGSRVSGFDFLDKVADSKKVCHDIPWDKKEKMRIEWQEMFGSN